MSRTLAIGTRLTWLVEPGRSEESDKLRRKLLSAHEHASEPISLGWKRLLYDEAMEIRKQCSAADWDGYDAAPISVEAAARTLKLIRTLPDTIAPPDLVPSPEGEISLEWQDVQRRMVSVTPRPDRLIWAAMMSDQHTQYGKAPLSEGWPKAVLDILDRYFPNARFFISRS